MKYEVIKRFFLRRFHFFLTLLEKWKKRKKIKIIFGIILSNILNVGLKQGVKENISLVRSNLRHHVLNINYLRFWKSEVFDQRVTWSNLDTLKSLMERYGRVIACSLHLGNYYLFPFEIARLGYAITVVVGDRLKQYNLVKEVISKTGVDVEVIFANKMTLFGLFKELKKGRIVYLLIDQFGGVWKNAHLLEISFLNQKARVKAGIGWLHYKSQLPLVPIASIRTGKRKHLIKVEQPIEYRDIHQDKRVYIKDITQELFGVLQGYVLRYPDQWLEWHNLRRFYEKDVHSLDRKSQESWEMKKEDRYKISKADFKIFRLEKSFILIDIKSRAYYTTDKLGRKIIKLLYRGTTLKKIVSLLEETYGRGDQRILKVLFQLRKRGLLINA